MIWVCAALAMDLDTARARATERAIEVARAEADASAARGATWMAASGGLPSVQLFASATTGAGLTQFGFERPVRVQVGAGVTGSWTLVAPGDWAAADAARHSAKGSRAMLDWARVVARRDATLAVAAVWAAQAELGAWEEAATDAEKAADGVKSLVETGLRPPADAARTRATAAALRARAIDARGRVAGRCAELQALLREPVTGECSLDVPSVDAPAAGEGAHPALVAAEEGLRAAKAARTGALLDRGPTVTATGTAAQYIAGDAKGLGWSAGIDARLPVVSGGQGIGANQVAAARRDDAELALEAQQLSLEAAGIAAEARWQASGATVEALEVSAAAAEEALALVEARYREGLEGLEAWLGARRARDEANVALALGRADRLRALAEVESVRGIW
ncbi:MAG: TolC family protein [Alphaproteobacteria bacterium]|nr:TolC family protein [Alphaproteobacteria bacterium]